MKNIEGGGAQSYILSLQRTQVSLILEKLLICNHLHWEFVLSSSVWSCRQSHTFLYQNLKCILCGDIDLTRFAENEHHGDSTQKYFIGQKYLMSNSAAAVLTHTHHTHHTLATLTRPKIPKDADNGLSNFLLSLLKPKQDQQGSWSDKCYTKHTFQENLQIIKSCFNQRIINPTISSPPLLRVKMIN